MYSSISMSTDSSATRLALTLFMNGLCVIFIFHAGLLFSFFWFFFYNRRTCSFAELVLGSNESHPTPIEVRELQSPPPPLPSIHGNLKELFLTKFFNFIVLRQKPLKLQICGRDIRVEKKKNISESLQLWRLPLFQCRKNIVTNKLTGVRPCCALRPLYMTVECRNG